MLKTQNDLNYLLGVVIFIKSKDIDSVNRGLHIDTWYELLPESFVHGGWVQVIVSESYYKELKKIKTNLDNLSTDLKL